MTARRRALAVGASERVTTRQLAHALRPQTDVEFAHDLPTFWAVFGSCGGWRGENDSRINERATQRRGAAEPLDPRIGPSTRIRDPYEKITYSNMRAGMMDGIPAR